jgi:hypothetical protein
MFIARDSFLYSLSYEIKNGREPLGYKYFAPNGTFSGRLFKGIAFRN